VKRGNTVTEPKERAATLRKVRKLYDAAYAEYVERAGRCHWSHPCAKGLEAVEASGVLGFITCGVEGIRGRTRRGSVAVEYLNTGDTYDETIIVVNDGRPKFGCWGNYAEQFVDSGD